MSNSKVTENHKINQSNMNKIIIYDSDNFETKIKNETYFFNVKPVLVFRCLNT
jgi:hypothetical protein